jgi:hypothetical protein
MTHSSTFPSAYARPTPACAFPWLGEISALTKTLLVNMLSFILAWKPRLAMLLPEFAVYRHLWTRDPCIDGISLPKKLTIHRYMH